ncbi:MAG: PAS domain S-box protein, partial [Gammaproteobacteria bacterium]|nr:PAS domain S-box protein [Gammaproteobacteria bacterium]
MKYVGLSNRLIVVFIAIEAIVMAVVGWRGAHQLKESYTQQYERAVEQESSVLVTALTEGLVKLDRERAEQHLSSWRGREDIRYITLFDHRMNAVASLRRKPLNDIPIERESSIIAAIADGIYHLSLPVELEGERIGTVKVGYDTQKLNQSIERAQLENILVPLLLFLALVGLTLVIGHRFRANLRRIERGIHEFQQGNFEHHIHSDEDGLFGEIAGAMNRFARDLRNKMGDLRVGNERLQESVEALQQEIISKTQTEAELQALQRRLLLQREQSPIGIIDWSTDFKVVDWNPAAERIFGYSKDEAIGQSGLDLIILPDNKDEISAGIWQKLLTESGSEHNINQNVTKEGKAITCEWYAAPIVNEDGEVIGVLSLVIDISEKRKQQLMLQRSQKMDALGKLTGGIAHDYNNMLGVVLGYASMLTKMLKDQPKLANYAAQIHRAGERGASLSKKLLAFSRNLASEPQEINVNELLLGEQLMLEKTLTARIKLVFDLNENSWPIWIDQSDLVDAVLNMSINAMHAMPDGGQLTINTQNIALNRSYAESMGIKAGDYMVLSITDTGTGIDPETQARIFEPFFTTKGERGSGLGLSQVYGMMQRAGGTIRLYSDLEHGSRFALYFPRYRCNIEDEDVETASVKQVTAEVVDGDSAINLGHGEVILVVDDEAGLRTVTEEFLSSAGYRVITAESGDEALKILECEHVDLLLSDVVMPGMDGYHLAA